MLMMIQNCGFVVLLSAASSAASRGVPGEHVALPAFGCQSIRTPCGPRFALSFNISGRGIAFAEGYFLGFRFPSCHLGSQRAPPTGSSQRLKRPSQNNKIRCKRKAYGTKWHAGHDRKRTLNLTPSVDTSPDRLDKHRTCRPLAPQLSPAVTAR
ncbi:hypothetical protein V8F20_003676 [Naviculisporaceae sp. PSN 640]